MLTGRGWWFLVFILAALVVALGGLPQGTLPRGFSSTTPVVAIICFALLAWFLSNWLLFVFKVYRVWPRLIIDRHLQDAHGELETLWARQPSTVSVALACDGGPSLPHVSITDRIPVLAVRREGEVHAEGPLSAGQPITLSYGIECPAPGRLRFEGLKVRVIDLHGFFSVNLFVREAAIYRVLPALADARGHVPAAKRHNLIPLMGTHPFRRAGSGSDLLDLRDYLPGDPPKMIAWKASARRDQLMTKELESEVPIRCTLFVDTSNATRVGPTGKNALARVLEIGAAVAQASARARDLTGLCVLDEGGVSSSIRPARGSRHLLRMMRALADAGDLFPDAPGVPLRRLIGLAYGLVQDIYPDYLERDLNAFPLWLPLWAPQPPYTAPQPPSKPGRLWARPFRWLWRRFRDTPLAVHRWRLLRFSRSYHHLYKWRKQVAAIMSVRYGLDPGGLATLLEDDELCRTYLERFLAEHQTPCPQVLYDEKGRYLFQSPAKLDVVADALLAAVRRGQDNELFVLLVDFLDAGPHLDRVVRAVKVARARHHQVIVICPWPAGAARPPGTGRTHETGKPPASWPTLHEVLAKAGQLRLHQAFARVREAFTRLGVTVVTAAEQDAVRLILYRMHRLRVFQRGVR